MGRAWCWAVLVGTHRPYLLVRDLDLDLPRRPGSRQLRGPGLWADANCETPHAHWSVGLEAFGVALDDPDEALGGERGERTGLGIDLEWEAEGPPVGTAGDYAAACEVHGEVLVGAGRAVETLAVDGAGVWRHRWGPVDLLAPGRSLFGRRADGTAVSWPAGPPPGSAVTVRHRAPLRLDDGARRAVLERFLVCFDAAAQPAVAWSDQVSQR
ncbi:MAG: hypothetical protein ACRD1K_02600 [Acidimicrobiales bacterium]